MVAIAPGATANSRQYRRTTGNFNRPGDTNAYAIGDLIANSTTAGSVVPLSWDLTGARPYDIPGIRLHKTGTATPVVIRCYIFSSTPTISTTGDNGVFASVVSGAANCMAIFEGTVYGMADGAQGLLVPISGVIKPEFIGDPTVYGLLEARTVYTPGNAETYTVTPIQEFQP